MIGQYVSQGLSVVDASNICGVAKSTYYYKSNGRKKGKKPSTTTMKLDGTVVSNSVIIDEIIKAITPDFTDYGYQLSTDYLKQHDYVINKKKVYRLMNENKLLHPPVKRSKGIDKQYIKFTTPALVKPFNTVETDIKYIYIHGERRNAFLITFLCTFCRYASTWELDYQMKANQVVELIYEFMNNPIVRYYLDVDKLNFTIRSDNGPQYIAKLLAKVMKDLNLKHEFIHPATPQENGHIESFHSTVQKLVCNRFEFYDLEHAKQVMREFYDAYNNIRMMKSLCSYPPLKFLYLWNNGYIGIVEKNKKQIFFLRERPTNLEMAGFSPEEHFCQNKFNSINNSCQTYQEISPVL